MKRIQKKTVHFHFEVTMSIDVVWHQPRRWNENSLNFKKTAFLFLRHVLNCCFSSCAILFWTFHFRSSKKVIVTKQSKAPSYETPNLVFCPPFWLRSNLVAWTFLVFVPAFFMPVVAKSKTVKHEQFSTIVDGHVNCFSARYSRKATNKAIYWAEEKMLFTSVKRFSRNKTFDISQR